ncbi:MAG: TlpA family protein disulfide reductase [Bacteroidales bacterium]|nr:TlpA family protein disulfide reductase [Bacteroidales bacterium]
MKKIMITFLFLLFAFQVLKSEPVTISGKVINGKGLTIRLMTYSDQVSYLRETLQRVLIGDDEMFRFTVEIDSVKYCWLDVEFQQAELFIQPGQAYEIEIALKDQSLSSSYYDRTGLSLKIIKDDDDRLNLTVQDFNQLYNEFLLDYAQKIRSGNSKILFDNFIKAIELRFQNSRNPFFINYVKYKTASMLLFMRLKSRDNIGLEYIKDQPVLYDHLEYMDFFHLYFEKYFLTGGKYFNYNKTYDLVNGTATAAQILDSLKTDPVLDGIDIRELLLLDGLKEIYNVSGFKRNRIDYLINEIAKNGNSAESRNLASNLLVRLARLQSGSPAPDFALSGVSNKMNYRLDDFTGKYLYLAFFDSQNPACQSELGMITDIYEEYKSKVAFVAISVDKNLDDLADYLQRADLPWLVLHYEGNLELLEQYDANTYPHFLLISDKGLIVRCPAPSPSENIQKLFGSF